MERAPATAGDSRDTEGVQARRSRTGLVLRITLVFLCCALGFAAVAGATGTAAGTAVVGASPPGGPAGTTAPDPTVAAIRDDRVHVIQRLALTPDRLGEVDVTVDVALPEPVVDFTLYLPEDANVVASDGFRRYNRTTYEWTGGDRRPELRYRMPVNETQERTGPLADDGQFVFVDAGNWAIVPRPLLGIGWRTRQELRVDRRLAVEGQGVAGETMAYLGPHETYTRESAGQRLTLAVPRAATLEEPPGRILDTLDDASRTVHVGDRDETVLGIAAPADVPWAARGLQIGETDFWAQADEPVASADNVWIHEYVHTRQDYEPRPSASWFTEGGATYYAALLTLEQGRISFEDFQRRIGTGTRGEQAESVLSRPDTWTGTAIYQKGALVAGVLDLRLRTATDRRRSLEDVFRRLNAEEEPVDADTFRSALRSTGGSSPVTAHDRFVTTSDVPDMWDARTHREAFGRPPVDIRYAWAGSDGPRVTGQYRNESFGTADPIHVVVGETLQVTARVRNDGTDSGPFEAVIAIGEETIGRASGTLGGGDSTTVSGSYTLEQPGSYQLTVGDIQRDVVVSDPVTATIANVDVQPRTVVPGERVTVRTTVTNEDETIPGRRDVIVEVDGEVASRTTVALAAGETKQLEETFTFDQPGEYAVGIRTASTVTVTVNGGPAEESPTASATASQGEGANQEGPDGEGPGSDGSKLPVTGDGVGAPVAFLVLLATVLTVCRRRG